MKKTTLIITCAISWVMALGFMGCSSNGNSSGSPAKQIISGGYIPSTIVNIEGGGEFDSSSLTPHDSRKVSLKALEGCWTYQGLEYDAESSSTDDGTSYTITDKSITLNGENIECLPNQIDIRPFSPLKGLRNQGFGYGAARVTHIKEEKGENETTASILGESYTIDSNLPYDDSCFICTTDGNTLALGFLGAEEKLDEFGVMADTNGQELSQCTLTEVDYEMSLDGDRLTLSYDGIDATYVQTEHPPLSVIHMMHWFGEPLNEGNTAIRLVGSPLRDLPDKGYTFDIDSNQLLPPCTISEEFSIETPGGAHLSAKLVNPYEKPVPYGFSIICWYKYDGNKAGDLTIGLPSLSGYDHSSQEFDVTPYSDVYNTYDIAYDTSDNSLTYKAGYWTESYFTLLDEGYDTGDYALISDRTCDINLYFDDNILSSISVSDPVYLSAGLQDNVAHDDLNELQPSVYRQVTEQRDEILDELRKAFKGAGLAAAIDERTGEVVMDSSVLFAKDSYELGEEGKDYLGSVFTAYASVVLDDKYSPSLKEVSFEGNTDSDGDSEYNMRLSELRARAVMEYCSNLLDNGQRSTFDNLATCRGYGESDLVYDEYGNEDMDASRRVAIKFKLDVDNLKSEAGTQSDDGGTDSKPSLSDNYAHTGDSEDSKAESNNTAELKSFRSISSHFNQVWSNYEKAEDNKTEHLTMLLLSDDHTYCAYLDLLQEYSDTTGRYTATGSYTFGKTNVEVLSNGSQSITVHHNLDNDKLVTSFDIPGKDNTIRVLDAWNQTNDLTLFDNIEGSISVFEEALSLKE